ncbi:MAG TPA: hypothetical protein VGK24_02655 [Candidatus Angelobacter sp.]|jgi:hypothetical protein
MSALLLDWATVARKLGKVPTAREYTETGKYSHGPFGHDPKKCDVIVCWIHNWPECPEWIEVVELSREVERIGRSGDLVIG